MLTGRASWALWEALDEPCPTKRVRWSSLDHFPFHVCVSACRYSSHRNPATLEGHGDPADPTVDTPALCPDPLETPRTTQSRGKAPWVSKGCPPRSPYRDGRNTEHGPQTRLGRGLALGHPGQQGTSQAPEHQARLGADETAMPGLLCRARQPRGWTLGVRRARVPGQLQL